MIWHTMLYARNMAWQIQVKVRTRQEVRSGSSFNLFTNFFRGSSGSLRGFSSGNSHEELWAKHASASIKVWNMGTVTINFILAVGALYVVVYQDDADEFNTLEGWFRLSRIGINTAVVLVFFALRALAVGTIRRERENTERHVMAFQRRHYALLGLQTCCLTYVACYAVSMPLMPFTITKGGVSVESSLNWRKCLHDFNTSYIADNCYREPLSALFGLPGDPKFNLVHASEADVRWSLAAQSGGHLICNEAGGYGVYRSLHDGCLNLLYKAEFNRLQEDALWASFYAAALLLVSEIIQGLDASVTRYTVFTDASVPVVLAAVGTLLGSCVGAFLLIDMVTFFCHVDFRYIILILSFYFWLGAVFFLLVDFVVNKFRSRDAKRETKEQKRERGEVEARKELEEKEGACTFYFVRAEHIRSWEASSKELCLPRFQELRKRGWLESRKINLADACKGGLSVEYLAVSHRWFSAGHPDLAGEQMMKMKEHLDKTENSGIKFVWYDFWCMPQGRDRTPAEKIEFSWMLKHVNFIYLGMRVLILLDLSYLSRFWTQFEAWLSMQVATTDGLAPASDRQQRFTIEPIVNGNSILGESLRSMWESKTPDEAFKLLAKDDVTVTNQSDKIEQLPKLKVLDVKVKEVMSGSGGSVMA